MSDHLRPHDAALARLQGLHPKVIDLSLGRLERLLRAMGDPHRRLPPTVHVAGTNGKGSTVAFLRAIVEAAGLRVHVFTSPHLVRFAERIRLAGTLITEEHLADVLARTEAANAGAEITFFEVTAAAFQAFAETPADLLLLEVGLGGRFDATNVIPTPKVAAIAPVDLDHKEFLGDHIATIAREKAGILKSGGLGVVAHQPMEAAEVIEGEAERVGARLLMAGRDFDGFAQHGRLALQAGDRFYDLPPPSLPASTSSETPPSRASPPSPLTTLASTKPPSPMGSRAPPGPPACNASPPGPSLDARRPPAPTSGSTAATTPTPPAPWPTSPAACTHGTVAPVALIVGLLARKDAAGVFAAFAPLVQAGWARVICTGFDAEAAADPQALAATAERAGCSFVTAAPDTETALRRAIAAAPPPHVIVCGSLYLAGEVLAMSPETWPR